MAKQNVAPTKTNLMKLRNELKFAELGYNLLDQKRNILIIELLNLVDQTVDFQNRVEESLLRSDSYITALPIPPPWPSITINKLKEAPWIKDLDCNI